MGIKKLKPLINKIEFKSEFKNLEKFLKINLRDINKNWPKKLPHGIIHGDLFIDNIFFKKNNLSGIIDRAIKNKIPMLALFPNTNKNLKDINGSEALNEDNLVSKAIIKIIFDIVLLIIIGLPYNLHCLKYQ